LALQGICCSPQHERETAVCESGPGAGEAAQSTLRSAKFRCDALKVGGLAGRLTHTPIAALSPDFHCRTVGQVRILHFGRDHLIDKGSGRRQKSPVECFSRATPPRKRISFSVRGAVDRWASPQTVYRACPINGILNHRRGCPSRRGHAGKHSGRLSCNPNCVFRSRGEDRLGPSSKRRAGGPAKLSQSALITRAVTRWQRNASPHCISLTSWLTVTSDSPRYSEAADAVWNKSGARPFLLAPVTPTPNRYETDGRRDKDAPLEARTEYQPGVSEPI